MSEFIRHEDGLCVHELRILAPQDDWDGVAQNIGERVEGVGWENIAEPFGQFVLTDFYQSELRSKRYISVLFKPKHVLLGPILGFRMCAVGVPSLKDAGDEHLLVGMSKALIVSLLLGDMFGEEVKTNGAVQLYASEEALLLNGSGYHLLWDLIRRL